MSKETTSVILQDYRCNRDSDFEANMDFDSNLIPTGPSG